MAFTGNNSVVPSQVSIIPFYLVQYEVTGKLRKFAKLSGEYLLCPHTTYENKLSNMFGVSYKTECELNLTSIFEAPDTTYVYELLLQDGDDFKDVPVAISNLVDASNLRPNQNKQGPEQLVLTRRFIIKDSLSGVVGATSCGVLNSTSPRAITFLQSARLVVEGQLGASNKIFKPYLLLTYGQKRVEDLSISNSTVHQYASVYNLDMSNFRIFIFMLFIIVTLIGGCVTVVRLYIWAKYFPSNTPRVIPGRGTKLITTSIFVGSQTIAISWFIFLLILTAYWFITFKGQDAVFTLLPSPSFFSSVYLPFYYVFWATLVLCLASTAAQLYRQSVVDILILDWVSLIFWKND